MKKLLVIVLAIGMCSLSSFAQTGTADLYGQAVLADGSKIPGVAVTLTGDVIGKKTTVTSEQGNYRFLQLPPGTYQLEFKLEGFKTVIHKGITLATGQRSEINAQMETTTIQAEVVEVTGKPNIIETRTTTVSATISKKMIESLPSARNPWTILNMIPGMMVDREDVGGNESGQQSSFYGHGGSDNDNTWNLDGANITDPSAIGAAPAYLNINSYEELQVTLGANDIKAQTGGTQLNFVSKSAGNRFSGDFHLYIEDEKWEQSASLPASITDKGWGAPGVFRLYQYGVNFGGPVVKDKLWFIGSYSVQDIDSRTITQGHDKTWLVSSYFKANFQLGNTSGNFHYAYDNKNKWNRTWLGAAQQEPGSMWDQVGPGNMYTGGLQHVMGNLMINAKFGYTDGGFSMDPVGADVMANGHLEGADWVNYGPWDFFGGACYWYGTDRNTINAALDGNYFAEGLMGGDHEIRFGVDYFNGTTTTRRLYPNQRVLFSPEQGEPFEEVWFVTDGFRDFGFKRYSFYISDTATFGNLTVNLGIRYDKEQGSHNAATLPGLTLHETGQPIFEDYMGPIDIPGKTVDGSYRTLSPRLSLTYDISGDGKNVVKLSVARYGGQSGNSIANHTWEWYNREIDIDWTDTNGNDVPDIGEFVEGGPSTWNWWNVNEQDPYSTDSRDKYGPDLNSPLLDELSVSFERALTEDMSLMVTGFLKKRHNLVWYRNIMEDGSLETLDNWYVGGTKTFSDGSSKDVWYRYERPIGSMMMNHGSDWYNLYKAVQLIFKKRLSGKWMLDASLTLMDWKAHRPASEYFDKTNYDFYNNGVVAPESGGSGVTDIFVNARWQLKISGLIQLPFGLNLTGVFSAREGYVKPYYERVSRPVGLSWSDIYKPNTKMGDDRLPTFWMLNLGLEKPFKVSDTVTATLFVDGYNITNNDITLKVRTRMDYSDYNEILRVLNPGLFQFGVRVSF
jgi:hypothetical protein